MTKRNRKPARWSTAPHQTKPRSAWDQAGHTAVELAEEAARQRMGLPARFELPPGFGR